MPNLKNCLRFLTPCQPRPEYPLFVFLPGMDGTGRLLHRQTPSLQKTFDIRCLAIPPDDLTDWDAMAKEVIGRGRAESLLSTLPFGTGLATFTAVGYWLVSRCHW
ncbi:MAG: hypothetical protein EBE86_021810 [Hormoscilla sp. GUM202]|nr:hypothetical protein [Hormoscilla sp. GUM202]